MFDVDTLIADCVAARRDADPRGAVKEVLAGAVGNGSGISDALPPERAEFVPLHISPELTVLKVVWTPGMRIYPHNHQMWAAIGIYSGGEDNAFYRRAPQGLTESGGTELREHDVCLLGTDTIHAVTNPTAAYTGAIHVYGGDLVHAERSQWDFDTFAERPYDTEETRRYFEDQNKQFEN
jgi:predicted metal-dependent enzyme (double-stranded beta helix superfamily)